MSSPKACRLHLGHTLITLVLIPTQSTSPPHLAQTLGVRPNDTRNGVLQFGFPQHQYSLPWSDASATSKTPATIAHPHSFCLAKALAIGVLVGLNLFVLVMSVPGLESQYGDLHLGHTRGLSPGRF